MPVYAPTSRLATATFTVNGVADDPDEIRILIAYEEDEATELLYGTDVEVVRVSAGLYRVEVDCTESGWWRIRFEGTWDDGVSAPSYRTYEESWYVSRSRITAPGS